MPGLAALLPGILVRWAGITTCWALLGTVTQQVSQRAGYRDTLGIATPWGSRHRGAATSCRDTPGIATCRVAQCPDWLSQRSGCHDVPELCSAVARRRGAVGIVTRWVSHSLGGIVTWGVS